MVVARFLALLEMFRDRAVAFDQLLPLGDLTVHWTADSQRLEQRKPERRIRGAAVNERLPTPARRAAGPTPAAPDVASLPGRRPRGPRSGPDGDRRAGHGPGLAAGLNLTVDVVETLLAELQREYNGYTVNAPDVDDASHS